MGKKIILTVVILALLALDWAALDDITTGNEPNYLLEYATLIISVIIFVFLGIKYYSKRKRSASPLAGETQETLKTLGKAGSLRVSSERR